MQKIGDIPNTRANNNGEFTDGNVAGGVPPTILPAEWFNTIQRELMSILFAAEIEADSDAFNQVLLSIQKLVSDGVSDIKNASLTQKGIVQLSSSTSSSSETLAATPKAVKAVLDASLPIDGTAAAATKLETAREIGGVEFDGTKDITLPYVDATDLDIHLAGNLRVKNLEVYPMPGSTEGGQIDLFDKDGKQVGFIDVDVSGNTRLVTSGGGASLVINKNTSDVSILKTLTATGVISLGSVHAGNGTAWIAGDGNIYGSVWGGYLSTYIGSRVRAWAAVQGDGTVISSVGFSAITRTNVGGYNFTMSPSVGSYAVTVGINGGSQSGATNAHSANIWNRTPNSFSVQNSNDGGTSYNWIDWPEFYVIVVGP
ncbi:phage tail protein [Yersinia hibernica]|uniref:phage tail protein n=1 Tax=Yersinia hibernica TaxID=2339259 RepID=UPI00042E6617|nr:phage tail protein [Yersinia hibernica]